MSNELKKKNDNWTLIYICVGWIRVAKYISSWKLEKVTDAVL